jgi:hypothetical protein
MIRDDAQYRLTQERVERFRAALALIDAEPTADPQAQQAATDVMRAQLVVLERALREYEARKERSR